MNNIDPRIDLLIDAYIDSLIDAEQFAELCDWLREDAANRQAFARKLALHSEIAEWSTERSGGALAGTLDTAKVEIDFPTIQYTASDNRAKGQYASALSYVLRHTFTPTRIVMIATSAAVLLLAVLLAVLLQSGNDAPHPVAERPDSTAPAPDPNRVVATITQQRGAIWVTANGEGALPERALIGPNQHLTLTQGYAEITTRRGAKAILEAPCAIEFMDDDNGFRLHHGKVACLVEGDRAKGFKVFTDQLEVTDFGTTFGVDASRSGTVQVHVYEGEVQVARSKPDEDGHVIAEHLFGGDAIINVPGRDAFVKIDADPAQFLATSTTVIKLPGTGFGLSEREVERGWAVVAIDGRELAEPIYWVVSDHAGATGVPHDPATAQWIARPITPVLPQGQSSQSYLIRTEVDLPPDLDPERARIATRFSADNELRSIRVNGHRVAVPPVNAGPNIDFHLTDMVIDRHLTQGTNIFEFEVINRAFGNVSAGDVSMYVAWELHIDPQWPTSIDKAGGLKTGIRKEGGTAF